MRGTRPLTDGEIELVLANFSGRYAARDRALFILGIRSGFRISEILSLKIGDIFQNGQILDRVSVRRSNMKGKVEGRSIALHSQAKAALAPWIEAVLLDGGVVDTHLFKSRNGVNNSISRVRAWKILNRVFSDIGLTGSLGTHCLRKTFADRVYEKLGRDLVKTQRALSHRNVNSTVQYLSFKEEQIDQAILAL